MNPLEAIRAEKARLQAAKAEIEQRLIAIEQSEKLLAPNYESQHLGTVLLGPEDKGLTDQIRSFLRASYPASATPTEIRDILVSAGLVDINTRSNFLAEIHNTLKRLVAQKDLVETTRSGAKAYQAAAQSQNLYTAATIKRTDTPPVYRGTNPYRKLRGPGDLKNE